MLRIQFVFFSFFFIYMNNFEQTKAEQIFLIDFTCLDVVQVIGQMAKQKNKNKNEMKIMQMLCWPVSGCLPACLPLLLCKSFFGPANNVISVRKRNAPATFPSQLPPFIKDHIVDQQWAASEIVCGFHLGLTKCLDNSQPPTNWPASIISCKQIMPNANGHNFHGNFQSKSF